MATLMNNDKNSLPRISAANPSEEKILKPKDMLKDKSKDIPTYMFTN